MPSTAYTDRVHGFKAITTNNYVDYGIRSVAAGRVQVTWPNTALTAGETIKAVVAFAYQAPYASASARILHWDDVTDHVIAVAEDITYGQTSAFAINEVRLD
jgi:hypothetical protein